MTKAQMQKEYDLLKAESIEKLNRFIKELEKANEKNMRLYDENIKLEAENRQLKADYIKACERAADFENAFKREVKAAKKQEREAEQDYAALQADLERRKAYGAAL